LIIQFGHSQNRALIDSLQTALSQAQSDSIKIVWLRKLAWYYLSDNPTLAKPYIDQIQDIAESNGDYFILAVANNYRGIQARREARYTDAIGHFQEALAFYQTDDKYEMASTGPLYNLGIIQKNIGNYSQALKTTFETLGIQKKHNRPRLVSETYNSLANLYKDLKDYKVAGEMYDSAYLIASKNGFDAELSMAALNKANLLIETKKFEEAIELADSSLQIDRRQGHRPGIAYSLEALANAYNGLGQSTKALQLAREAHTMNVELNRIRDALVNTLVITRIYHKMQNIPQALSWGKQALVNAETIGDIESQLLAEEYLAEIYEDQNNFLEANRARRNAKVLADSLFAVEKIRLTKEYETRFEVEQKEIQINHLEKENRLTRIVLKRQKTLRAVLLAGLALLAFCLILVYRILYFRLRANTLKREREQLIHKQTLESLRGRQKIEAMNAMLKGQEKERNRIAKDLHDSLGSLLSTIKYQFESILQKVTTPPDQATEKTGLLIDNACTEVRRIAHNMMPETLIHFGLIPAVEDFLDHIRDAGIQVHLENMGIEDRLSLDQESMLYRIVQEALQNVLKHAKAEKVIVQFSKFDNHVYIVIEDNGIGMDQHPPKEGQGMANIRSRVDYLGGELKIESSTGIGTTLNLKVPATIYNLIHINN
jgi:signal transduction histidine kinase